MNERIDRLRAEYDAAQVELNELLEEERQADAALDRARREDAGALLEATRSGGRLTSALKTLTSKARGVAARRESLPELVWAARLRAAECEEAYLRELAPALEDEWNRRRAVANENREELRKLEARQRELNDYTDVLSPEMISATTRLRDVRHEHDALLKAGPPGSAAGLTFTTIRARLR